jgi:hypothetical protein
MNVSASNHECGMPCSMKRCHPSRYDIKQIQSECARHYAVRLYPSLKCPTCEPPRDANIEKKKTRPGHWMRKTQGKGKNKRSLKITEDDETDIQGNLYERRKPLKSIERRPMLWYVWLSITHAHRISSRGGYAHQPRVGGEGHWTGQVRASQVSTEDRYHKSCRFI